MRTIRILAGLLLLAGAPLSAGTELLLEDGQVVEGRSIQRKGSLILLKLESGAVVPFPVELVREVRLTGDDEPAPSGMRPGRARTLVGPPQGPVLAKPAEQLEAFGENRSTFRRSVISPYWFPESDWADDPALNNFNPTRWYRAPIDAVWIPTSAFRASDDATQFNPARWYRAPIDPTWYPTDGFGDR